MPIEGGERWPMESARFDEQAARKLVAYCQAAATGAGPGDCMDCWPDGAVTAGGRRVDAMSR